MPVEHIARIEIIRGPGSALYGADAYSGVINIITKNAADIGGTELGARAGSFGSYDAWLQHGSRQGNLEVAAYLRAGSTDGFRKIITSDSQTRTDAAFGTRASLAPGPVNVGRDAVDGNLDLAYGQWRWRSSLKWRDNIGTGAGVNSALDPVGSAKSERVTHELSWANPQLRDNLGGGFSASALYYRQLYDRPLVLLPPGTKLPTGTFTEGMLGAPEFDDRAIRVSGWLTYSGIKGHNLRAGIGHDDIQLYNIRERKNFSFAKGGTTPVPAGALYWVTPEQAFILPQQRKIDYVYLQDEWQLASDWAITGGMRHDRYSDFGSTTNPRLAVVWDVNYNLTAKLLYGEAFRAPSFNEEYSINNPVARGNPALRPETIKTAEMAFSWVPRKDAQLNLNFFRYDMQDIIRLVPNATPGTGSTYFNTGSQKGHGLELEGVWQATRDLHLLGNYAWQRSTDKTSGRDPGFAPRHHFHVRADWNVIESWQLSTQLNRVSKRLRAAGDTRPAVPDYTAVDFTVHTSLGRKDLDLSLSLRNAFNADIREPATATIANDLPQAGRAWVVQASFKL